MSLFALLLGATFFSRAFADGLVVSGVQTSNITGTAATITWTTSDSADSQVGYGLSVGSYQWSPCCAPDNTTNHVVTISGLIPATTYHFIVESYDGTNLVDSPDTTFTTAGASGIVVSDVVVSSVSDTTVAISFTTNISVATYVAYGTNGAYALQDAPDLPSTTHVHLLSGLTPATTYSYEIGAIVNSSQLSSAPVAAPTPASTSAPTSPPTPTATPNPTSTPPPTPTSPPVIQIGIPGNPAANQGERAPFGLSEIIVANIAATTVDVDWQTSVPADSQVGYGLSAGSYQWSPCCAPDNAEDHSVTLSGLTPATTYHFVVESTALGATLETQDKTFTTANAGVISPPTTPPASSVTPTSNPGSSSTPPPAPTSTTGVQPRSPIPITNPTGGPVPRIPPVTSTPTSTSVSTSFTIGERVQVVTSALNVRDTASTAGTLLGTQPVGALGVIAGGPVSADGYSWWNVFYDTGVSGWSIGNYLAASSAAKPKVLTALGSDSPTEYINGLAASLTAQGYIVSKTTDAIGEIVGMASKNGKPAFYFDLGDQMVSPPPPQANIGQCLAQYPSASTSVPVMVAPDGTIPHLSTDFNVVVDPSAFSIPWDTQELTQEDIRSDIVQGFNEAYAPYAAVSGLPQPTQDTNAGAVVVLDFANIPASQYTTYENGQYVTENGQFEALTDTIIPQPGVSASNYVPPGSSQLITDALSAGKQVVIVTYNTAAFGATGVLDIDWLEDTEHEMGHALGLGDDYNNLSSPMRADVQLGLIDISPAIAQYLSGIQNKTTFKSVSCGIYTLPTQPSDFIPAGYVPIYEEPTSSAWFPTGSCTTQQLADGMINDPAASGGCRMTIASSSILIGNDNNSYTGICLDNYGNWFACSPTSCGALGEPSCPVNIPPGVCLDQNGNSALCTNPNQLNNPEPNIPSGTVCDCNGAGEEPDCTNDDGNVVSPPAGFTCDQSGSTIDSGDNGATGGNGQGDCSNTGEESDINLQACSD